jgi:glycosyltransferase involved in cell wall biosynthesis
VSSNKSLNIAVIGVKGVGNGSGGIERHVEELYPRLVERGHKVTVYCRPNHTPEGLAEYKGMKIRMLPSLDSKHLDAITHTLVSSIDSLFRRYDVIHYHAIGPSLLSFIPRLRPKTMVCSTVHGLDWQREKWGRFAAFSLRLGEKCSALFPHKTITVSKDLESYYKNKYPSSSIVYIPNGVNEPLIKKPDLIFSNYTLSENRYILFAARLVPEKGCHYLIEAFKSVKTDIKLVIAGGSSHSDDYAASLKKLAEGDDRIVFTGHVTGQLLEELFSNAYMYVLPSDIEGLPIALLEALSYGLPVLCSNIPPHLEVGKANATESYCRFFSQGDVRDLSRNLESLIGDAENARCAARQAKSYVVHSYNWDKVANETVDVFRSLVNLSSHRRKESRIEWKES